MKASELKAVLEIVLKYEDVNLMADGPMFIGEPYVFENMSQEDKAKLTEMGVAPIEDETDCITIDI